MSPRRKKPVPRGRKAGRGKKNVQPCDDSCRGVNEMLDGRFKPARQCLVECIRFEFGRLLRDTLKRRCGEEGIPPSLLRRIRAAMRERRA